MSAVTEVDRQTASGQRNTNYTQWGELTLVWRAQQVRLPRDSQEHGS